jgi:hypothetical protein
MFMLILHIQSMKMSDLLFSDLPNPKQNGTPIMGRHTWYPYYAGYSPIFVHKVLERANLIPAAIVCDPYVSTEAAICGWW